MPCQCNSQCAGPGPAPPGPWHRAESRVGGRAQTCLDHAEGGPGRRGCACRATTTPRRSPKFHAQLSLNGAATGCASVRDHDIDGGAGALGCCRAQPCTGPCRDACPLAPDPSPPPGDETAAHLRTVHCISLISSSVRLRSMERYAMR